MNHTLVAKESRGKRGRGAYKKTPVFGIFKRGGKVYTEVVPDCAKATSILVIKKITESTMELINLPMANAISTALNCSGFLLKVD